ncbi:MAG: phosphatase family protein [Solirubrobacteraceae bacterium]|nr:phosphatase family protein [Solirubrobacteraceae bacterium]
MLRQPRSALLGAFACAVGLVVTGAISHLVPAARLRDSASLSTFASLGGHGLDGVLNGIAHLADPGPYIAMLVSLVLVALHRGRRRLALVVPVVLLMAPVTAEALKHLTAESRGGSALILAHVAEASWPSGHATGALALALCAVLVAPPRLRPVVATIGGIFALAVSYSVLVLVWHFPSDVIGGYFVAAGWSLLAVAALRRWPDWEALHADEDRDEPAPLGAAILVACAAALVAVVVAFHRRGALADRLAEHPSFVIAAVAIAMLAAGLAAVLVRTSVD